MKLENIFGTYEFYRNLASKFEVGDQVSHKYPNGSKRIGFVESVFIDDGVLDIRFSNGITRRYCAEDCQRIEE